MTAKHATLLTEAEPTTGLTDAVKEVALTPSNTDPVVQMFDRWVSDPNASVEKIERLMALYERSEAKKAETAFNAAMSQAQKEIRPVVTDEYNPQTRSKFASYEALDAAVRPIYTAHGFGLSFDTGYDAPPDHVRILCYVTHDGGHARTYHADMPADGKGAKGGDVMTRTHAAGSAMSYGQRYLLKLIFNIPIKDDDGNKAGRVPSNGSEPPPKFDEWWSDMIATADDGIDALEAAWKNTKNKALKEYAQQRRRQEWADLKKKAEGVATS